MSMTEYLAREMKRNDEDLLREINKIIRSLGDAGNAVRAGEGTYNTDTDWLCSSAAKVERMIEKRNLVGMLVAVDEKGHMERNVPGVEMEAARLAAEIDADDDPLCHVSHSDSAFEDIEHRVSSCVKEAREVRNPWDNSVISCKACGGNRFHADGRSLDMFNWVCVGCGATSHTMTETGMSA